MLLVPLFRRWPLLPFCLNGIVLTPFVLLFLGGRYYRSASNAVGFQLIEEAKTWAEAAEFCAIKRMCLATLSTEEQKVSFGQLGKVSCWCFTSFCQHLPSIPSRFLNNNYQVLARASLRHLSTIESLISHILRPPPSFPPTGRGCRHL